MQSKKFLVIGTAGHIDHGKTSLVKALTGVDTDRWEEEKRRGMTIDLGFAKLELPDGTVAGIVDVPGHEKFIKNMVAGAHGLDMVLFVVAADEGIMPQTKEHLTVCESLGTKRGIVVLTKKDAVEPEWLELVKEEVEEFTKGTFLEKAPVVAVSSKTGEGIEELKRVIAEVAEEVEPKRAEGILRLPVDRSFTVKGFGTVVTGTLLSGRLRAGDRLELLPAGREVKARSVQVHGRPVEEAVAGQRTAVNVPDLKKEEVKRGDLLATPDYLKPTDKVDAVLKLSKDADVIVTSGHKVHFHHLTKEVEGEVFLIDRQELLPGESALVQIRLKGEVVPMFKDRFVVRHYSPARVIGGGEILNPLPPGKFRRRFAEKWKELLKPFTEKNAEEIVLKLVEELPGRLSPRELVQFTALSPEEVESLVERLKGEKRVLVSEEKLYPADHLKELKAQTLKLIEEFHSKTPILEGPGKESVRGKLKAPKELFERAIRELKEEGKLEELEGSLKLTGFTPSPEGRWKGLVERAEESVREKGLKPPTVKELAKELSVPEEEAYAVASYLKRHKGFHRFADFLMAPEALETAVTALKELFSGQERITVSQFKDRLGISRKFAVPLLEYLDQLGFTCRTGNERVRGEKLK
ncbi:selenocysteine-specific translation elongation factor [Thermovibrio ammonificans HB-1]|uniref:Selenocysteine-specific elongation factor n=1 Tax=Thermovibrio ammonificans (strain DSM 15698 / JCM 12110 / HB-1) TaxID=648996 RepID=E8T2W3_THEA1|nr:selenocysteine-specific translation elongation factor [Thermovibrio ammonificans]ADU97172.1 selenocysteine-specific translation elongation factor [Thermovibrio ammonificans HB-1]